MKGNSFHDQSDLVQIIQVPACRKDSKFTYKFENFFHPFVGDLIQELNKESLPDMLDPVFLERLAVPFFDNFYTKSLTSNVVSFKKEIDVSDYGPYSNYNWELFFHFPLTIAVHLSKNQRFAEAQHWFHYIFDPTSNDPSDDPKKRFWKFLAFRNPKDSKRIEDIVELLSIPNDKNNADQQAVLDGYNAILNNPFQPHKVAQTRQLAYQYYVVMKYLDNLIDWGDHLFLQDTVESINEATQIYVLAANILGERPQRIPPLGKVKAQTFAQLKKKGLGPIGDTFAELEGQFPLDLISPNVTIGNSTKNSGALFGIGRTLYFCIPPNANLLGYWDIVADRLFKIRHCMNIEGVVRPLALFDSPIDPGMLVKAVAAGIDISSIVSGLNQPIGPVRSLLLIQKALELCGEVRNLGNSLLSALEKGDAEHLALIRQHHEIQIQQDAQEVKYLQWKSAQESTKALILSRNSVIERFHYYARLLGLSGDLNAPGIVPLDKIDDQNWPELTEENFDDTWNDLVKKYDDPTKPIQVKDYLPSDFKDDDGVRMREGEYDDLNGHSDRANIARTSAASTEGAAAGLSLIPAFHIKAAYWGVGTDYKVTGGEFFSNVSKAVSTGFNIWAQIEEKNGQNATKKASYENREDDWIFNLRTSADELAHIGRQIVGSLITEQIAHHEYLNIQQQIKNAQEIQQFLDAVNFPDKAKFTNEQLYLWMQGEISRLYYEYYRFAFDTARKAEKTMKQELMRPEVDVKDYVKFNYWDGGRKGLLSGEALYLDVKRMEMAYHDNNKRELELTKHVSLRQLNPVALLTLKATGTCQVTIPEWLYDLDCPGHYMRRIKSIALSIPSVAGPYTSVNCTLSLLRSSLRKSPIASEDYIRQGSEDDRFVDYIGAAQSFVTSSGVNDNFTFETNLRDDRLLPFEGAGAVSTWKLDLPKQYRAFDYGTISDVILHIRYTARQGIEPGKVTATLNDLFQQANQAGLVLLFSLRHDFPTEWAAFVNGKGDFSATIRKDYFPYFTQGKTISIIGLELYDGEKITNHKPIDDPVATPKSSIDLTNQEPNIAIKQGINEVLKREASSEVFLVIRYTIG